MYYCWSSTSPLNSCFALLPVLIVPNFRSLCHIPLTHNCSSLMNANSGTHCHPHANNDFPLLSVFQLFSEQIPQCLHYFSPHDFDRQASDHITMLHRVFVLWLKCMLVLSRSEAAAVLLSSVCETTAWRRSRQSCRKPPSCMCSMFLETGRFSCGRTGDHMQTTEIQMYHFIENNKDTQVHLITLEHYLKVNLTQ